MDGSEAQGSAAVVDEAPIEEAPTKAAADPKAQKKDGSQPASRAAKEQGPPPWAKDLDERGINSPEVDQYLREVWQPRMTQHEQQLAEWQGLFGDGGMDAARIGAGLLEALEADPEGTYQQIGELLGLTAAEVEEMAEDGDELSEAPEQSEDDEVSAYVRQLMEREQQQEQDARYQQLLDALAGQFEGFDENLFNMAMLAHEGDVDAALQAYQAYHRAPESPKEDAPPTLGDGTAPTPREAPNYGSIGESIEAFLSEEKARRGN